MIRELPERTVQGFPLGLLFSLIFCLSCGVGGRKTEPDRDGW
jgi:hypothetical protein